VQGGRGGGRVAFRDGPGAGDAGGQPGRPVSTTRPKTSQHKRGTCRHGRARGGQQCRDRVARRKRRRPPCRAAAARLAAARGQGRGINERGGARRRHVGEATRAISTCPSSYENVTYPEAHRVAAAVPSSSPMLLSVANRSRAPSSLLHAALWIGGRVAASVTRAADAAAWAIADGERFRVMGVGLSKCLRSARRRSHTALADSYQVASHLRRVLNS